MALLVCLALVGSASEPAYSQGSDFDASASRLADAVLLLSRGLIVKPSVEVMDFVETHGGSDEMGKELSRQFSHSLAKIARDFLVPDPNGGFDAFGADRSASHSTPDAPGVDCSAGQPKPTFLVEGYLDELPDRVVVRIKATRTEDNKAVFDERITLALTPELKSLESKPLSPAEMPSSQNGPTWVRPGFHLPNNGANVVSMESVDNYTPPRCLECPHADYPDSAVAAKVQGVIKLRILVDATGQPEEIIVLKGLPCGINERAIETVSTWKLEPAKGPDGKPAAVWQNAELSFSLAN